MPDRHAQHSGHQRRDVDESWRCARDDAVPAWKVVGVDADFGHDTMVDVGGQTAATGGAAGAVVNLRTRCTNSTGTTFSTVKVVTLV